LGINVELKKGHITALIGESGSGKSTLTDLILGLEKPNSGNIFIDNIPLSAININSLRDRIGYVPQDPQLFHASIRDNLLWSYDSASEARLWEVLELANAANFVNKLPDKLDTIVGDRGTRLSGGQRQRIALARALIRMPILLILDEATSALDSESESLIQQSIEKVAGDVTVLIVAHRLSTIANANKIYILSSGKIVEDGSFEQLRSNPNGLLNSMLSGQYIS
jgi:ATP-binding cassette subfamily B protein